MSAILLKRWTVNAAFVGALGYAFWAARTTSDAPARASTFGFALREVSRERGIDFTHQPCQVDPKLAHIEPHVAGMGAAVSVCDANGDGWPDLYATNSKFGAHNALFVNRGDGTFMDRALHAGLADVNRAGEGASTGSIWADFDGDGDQDCYLYKWGYPQLFRNDGALRFTDVTEAAGLRRWKNVNGACWIDYDRDGYLDLYVAGYFRDDVDLWNLTTTKIMQESFEFARNGGTNVLFRNLGDGRFEDVTETTGCGSTRWTLAVAAADLDGDGWQDLYLANDYGPEELFRNVNGERFERAENVGLEESSKSGMCVALGDFQNDGRLGVYVTNISERGYLMQGNNLRVNRLADRGWLQNVAEGAVADCGWAWGAQFGDFDNDGRADLYVVNGFVSSSTEHDYWYGMTKVAIGAGSLAEDATYWPPMEDRSLSGYQRSKLLLNQGRMRFVDAAAAVGADDLLDGRAVALADLDRDGSLDVVIANQKGRLLVYANTVEPARGWIAFALRGKGPNTSAVGAEVRLEAGAATRAQVVQAGSGFCSQNDFALHFGLGDIQPTRAVVRWPSGASSTLEAPALRTRIEVHEP